MFTAAFWSTRIVFTTASLFGDTYNLFLKTNHWNLYFTPSAFKNSSPLSPFCQPLRIPFTSSEQISCTPKLRENSSRTDLISALLPSYEKPLLLQKSGVIALEGADKPAHKNRINNNKFRFIFLSRVKD